MTFTPQFPGIRYGAVVLLDSSVARSEIAAAYIHGTGQGAQLAIDTSNPYDFYQCLRDYDFHLALDGSGLIYAYDGLLYKVILSSDNQSCNLDPIPVPNGANSGLALDGAGNIYATAANAIEKLTPPPAIPLPPPPPSQAFSTPPQSPSTVPVISMSPTRASIPPPPPSSNSHSSKTAHT